MLEPVGPLAPEVYWRRRAVALVVLIAAIAMIAWVVGRIFAGGESPVAAASGSSSTAPSSPAHAFPGAAGASSAAASESASGSESTSAGGSASTGRSTSHTEAAPVTTATPADPAPADPAPTDPAPAPAPTACDPAAIEVQAAVATDPIRSGDKPTLVLSVINHSQTGCLRDLNAAGQELLIYGADGARLWSSNDCYPESSDDTRLLAPGQKVDFSVVWSGKGSSPGCGTPRHTLGAGSYQLEAVQGGVVSARVPLSIQG